MSLPQSLLILFYDLFLHLTLSLRIIVPRWVHSLILLPTHGNDRDLVLSRIILSLQRTLSTSVVFWLGLFRYCVDLLGLPIIFGVILFGCLADRFVVWVLVVSFKILNLVEVSHRIWLSLEHLVLTLSLIATLEIIKESWFNTVMTLSILVAKWSTLIWRLFLYISMRVCRSHLRLEGIFLSWVALSNILQFSWCLDHLGL